MRHEDPSAVMTLAQINRDFTRNYQGAPHRFFYPCSTLTKSSVRNLPECWVFQLLPSEVSSTVRHRSSFLGYVTVDVGSQMELSVKTLVHLFQAGITHPLPTPSYLDTNVYNPTQSL